MGLGSILECHDAFQWDLATVAAADTAAWRLMCLYPYRGVVVSLIFVPIQGALIAFLIVLQW